MDYRYKSTYYTETGIDWKRTLPAHASYNFWYWRTFSVPLWIAAMGRLVIAFFDVLECWHRHIQAYNSRYMTVPESVALSTEQSGVPLKVEDQAVLRFVARLILASPDPILPLAQTPSTPSS